MGIAITLGITTACGKKGPPLAPLVRIPASVEQISARRVGSDVYVTLTIPSANLDQFTPADVGRIEIFGYTGRTPPPRPRFAELGTLIATVPVAPPPPPPESGDEKPAAKAATRAEVTNAPAQGTQITIRDALTADGLVQGKEPVRDPVSDVRDPASDVTEPQARKPEMETRVPPSAPLKRFYMAFAFSPRGRPSPPGAVAEFPLLSVPDPPPSVDLAYTEQAVSVTWEPSGGLIGFLLERTLPQEPLPVELEELLAVPDPAPSGPSSTQPAEGGPILYNVYRTTSPDPFAPPPPDDSAPAAWTEQPPSPQNAAPLASFEFTDTIDFGRERCYTVRAVRGVGPDARIGAASPPACVTPVDTFAPAPPQGLATVASEGVISLIWEPSTERDLGGYMVLRGEAADATLQPLTLIPITESAYRDTAVTPGARYAYAVIAVDNRFPVPNMSAASTPIEETAR